MTKAIVNMRAKQPDIAKEITMIKMYSTEDTGKNIIMYHEVLNKIRAESEDEYTP